MSRKFASALQVAKFISEGYILTSQSLVATTSSGGQDGRVGQKKNNCLLLSGNQAIFFYKNIYLFIEVYNTHNAG